MDKSRMRSFPRGDGQTQNRRFVQDTKDRGKRYSVGKREDMTLKFTRKRSPREYDNKSVRVTTKLNEKKVIYSLTRVNIYNLRNL